MKIVIDTNVVASALFFGGKPFELLKASLLGNLEAFVSNEIIEEYNRTIERLAQKYPGRPKRFPLDDFVASCTCIQPVRKISVCRDPDDNKFIECAVESHSVYIVSGDNDLLSLNHFENIAIVTVSDFFCRNELI